MEQSYTITKENVDQVFTNLMTKYKEEHESSIYNFAIPFGIMVNLVLTFVLILTINQS